MVIVFITATTLAQKRQPPKKPSNDQILKEQLDELNAEIAALLARVPGDEEQLQQAMANIRSEMRLRELRWRAFERGPAVDDEPFKYHPIRVDLLATYERLTDMLLALSAANYLVIVDDLNIKRAPRQAPLVSVEASFYILLYSIDDERRAQLLKREGATVEAQLESARRTLALLNPRFEERVASWSVTRALGKRFPKSLETILMQVAYNEGKIQVSGVSRSALASGQIANSMAEAQIFADVKDEQRGPTFKLEALVAIDKAYQQWLEGADTTDQESLPRDPFTTTYSLQQLTQGSSANANYPPLDKRIEEYLQQVNAGGRRPERISPYLVAELSLAGVFYAPNLQGAIFKTPNEKEIYVAAGARCYNGRFTDLQQGRALFEEMIVDGSGKTAATQVVKTIESPNCFVVSPLARVADAANPREDAARAKLPSHVVTLNVANVELHSLLPLLHELSGKQFGYIVDRTVGRACVNVNRERIPFGDILVGILHSTNLTMVEENGLYRIIAREQGEEALPPAIATSFNTPPPAGRIGSPEYRDEPVTLSITDVELGDVLKFFTAKFGVQFAIAENARRAKVTASVTETEWTRALAGVLRSVRLGALVEGERVLIVGRDDLKAAQAAGKVKIVR